MVDASGAKDFSFSASAVATYRLCPRKYFYSYVMGIKSPAGPGAALGSEIHKQLEDWLTKSVVPDHARAKALLPLLPLPSKDLDIEHAFRILFPVGAAKGFIDVLIRRPSIVKMPADFPKVNGPIVIDHKTTSDLSYAKTEEDLLTDPQAVLYGIEARLRAANRVADVPEVGLAWQYTTTRGKAATHRTFLKQTLPILESGLELVLNDARVMRDCHEQKIDDVPFSREACDAFGGCPYRNDCAGYRSAPSSQLDFLGGETMNIVDKIKELNEKKRLEAAASAAKAPEVIDSHAQESNGASEGIVKPSPEPELKAFDTSKVEDEPAAINPPDAAPNLTPDNSPEPVLETKGKRKRATTPTEVVTMTDDAVIISLLKGRVAKAFDDGDLGLVGLLTEVAIDLRAKAKEKSS